MSFMLKTIVALLMFSTLLFSQEQATYIGDKACAQCHTKEMHEWQGSHHELAMKEPNDKTVVGDFNNATFELQAVQSSFYKKGDKYFIKTEGEDGKLHE